MDNITYSDFQRLDLRVGQVLAAEEIPGADKLLKLRVDIGTEVRELVAGIKMFYSPDSLVGRKIAVLTNLEPRTIRGVISQGMVLAGSTEGVTELALLSFDKDLPVGSIIK